MAWYWTDDIARALIASGTVPEAQVQDWLRQPHAIAAPADIELVTLGSSMLGLGLEVEAGAA